MRTFVINLDQSRDRWRWTSLQAKRLGIHIERIPAVDGSRLDSEKRAALLSANSEVLSTEEVGCVLSHRNAWAEIAKGNDLFGAILEDDLHLSDGIREFLTSPEWIPPGVDLVRLETFTKVRCIGRPIQTVYGRSLHIITGPTLGAGGYIISRELARTAIEATELIPDAADELMFGRNSRLIPRRCAVQVSPALCIQDKVLARLQGRPQQFPSALAEARRTRWDNAKKRGFQKLLHEARRIGAQTSDFIRSAPLLLLEGRSIDVPFR